MEARILELLNGLTGLSVLAVGDIMLDRYIYGDATRISPEAPVPVVQVRKTMATPGGVGNVWRNLADLGLVPRLVSVSGDDQESLLLERELTRPNLPPPRILRDPARPTSVKTRLIAGIQQVVRFDAEMPLPLGKDMAERFLAAIQAELPAVAAVAVSDYGKGTLMGQVALRIIDLAHAAGKVVVIDPKGQDYSRYRGADLVKPNRRELAEATGQVVDDLESAQKAARILMQEHGIANVLVTLSDKGMLLLTAAPAGGALPPPLVLPSRARAVFDVTGAGDTVLSVMAAGLARGASLELSARLAMLAAGVVVGKVGTATACPEEIRRFTGF
jgi:D-beta-D-heptose 7-phosphate kinase/D-beta-D-heptose 1-phosphate adenosyltransferase